MFHPFNAVHQTLLVSARKTYPELLAEQESLGRKILSDIKDWSKKHDKNKLLEIHECWRKFFSNYEELRFAGLRDDKYYAEIEAAIIQTRDKNTVKSASKDANKMDDKKLRNPASESHAQEKDTVDRFLENVKSFKELLYKHKAIIESCDHLDLILQELKLRFEMLKEDSKNVSVKNDQKAQEDFNKVITLYFGILRQAREQMQKKENASALLPWSKSLETDMTPQSETDQMQLSDDEKLFFDNFIDTLVDQPKLNSKIPENIRKLLQNTTSLLRSITKMGLNAESAKLLIARIIIRKFDKELLQQYECKIKKQNQTQKLEDVFDFLRQLILQTQKEENNFKNDEKSENTSKQKRKSKGKQDKRPIENEENEISNDFDKLAIESIEKPPLELLIAPMASAESSALAEKHDRMKITFVTKANEVSLCFTLGGNSITKDDFLALFFAIRDLFERCKLPLFATHQQGLFEFRFSSSPHPSSKRESAEILEMHIRNLRAGILLKAGYVGSIILNLHTPGLSEVEIRDHYASADTPESLKAFISPLLEKTGTLLHKIIIFPEDDQENCNETTGHNNK